MSPVSAEQACRQYDHWAAECQRLTREISEIECPHEERWDDGEAGPVLRNEGRVSCFQRARTATVRTREGRRPIWLGGIRKAVVPICQPCTKLCDLISERREARKQWGIAKRRVRAVGKRLYREADEAP